MRIGGSILTTLLCSSLLGGTAGIDFSAWDGSTLSPVNGWTLSGVKKTSVTGDYAGGAGFAKKGARLSSPSFSAPLTKATIEVASSQDHPPRVLRLFPLVSGLRQDEGIALTPHVGAYDEQVFDLTPFKADAFDLELGAGSNGNWYVRRVLAESEGEPLDPPEEEGTNAFTAVTWSLSHALTRTADFSSLASVTSKTFWRNGVDGDGFLAFTDAGAPCEVIRPNTGRSTASGLYATVTNDSGEVLCALSYLATSGNGMNILLPVQLEAPHPIETFTVNYRSHQVSFLTNCVSTTNAFSWCTLEAWTPRALAAAEWRPVAEGDHVTSFNAGVRPARISDASAERTLVLPAVPLRQHTLVCLRWSVAKRSRSSMMGLSNVRVTATLRAPGLGVFLR